MAAPKRGEKPPLSEKHQRFIEEYLIDLNATQAAIRAGYSAATAYSQGQRLLKHVEVKKSIAKAKRERAERMAISQDRVLLELARIAYFDIRKTVDANGAPIPIQDLDADTAAAIAGIEALEQWEGSGEDRVLVGLLKKYKVFDKNTAVTNASGAICLGMAWGHQFWGIGRMAPPMPPKNLVCIGQTWAMMAAKSPAAQGIRGFSGQTWETLGS